jgi:competence protein ComEC
VALLAPTSPVTGPPDGWRVVFCDVGQGDAALLRSGPSSAVLVDTGPDPPAVDGCLRRYRVERLDAVVLTHFHADHVEGLPGALDGRVVRRVLATPVREPAPQVRDVERWSRARGIPLEELHAGGRLEAGEVAADVWAPARRIDAGSVPNNASVVLAARVGRVDVLLLGDVEREAAHDLLLRARRDPAMASRVDDFDVVKTPHHGSANLDDDLMALVRAPVAVVSVGADNDYGHPTARHLAMLRRDGYTVYRTDQRGDVVLVEREGEVGVLTTR